MDKNTQNSPEEDHEIADPYGYVSIWRKIQDSKLWLSEPFTRAQAWIDLVLMANHKETFFFIRGNKVTVKRGQLARGENYFADRWGWSRNKVRNFLKLLKTEQQIEQQKTAAINIITIKNYNFYQKRNNRKTTERQQKDTYNNVNNVNNNLIGEKNEKELTGRDKAWGFEFK